MAVLEYEFGRDNHYTEEQMDVAKHILARVCKFFTDSGKEWAEYETQQAVKKEQAQQNNTNQT